jgi:hypothetical protein
MVNAPSIATVVTDPAHQGNLAVKELQLKALKIILFFSSPLLLFSNSSKLGGDCYY